MITIDCPQCGQGYRLHEGKLGHRARCRKCQTVFVVEANGSRWQRRLLMAASGFVLLMMGIVAYGVYQDVPDSDVAVAEVTPIESVVAAPVPHPVSRALVVRPTQPLVVAAAVETSPVPKPPVTLAVFSTAQSAADVWRKHVQRSYAVGPNKTSDDFVVAALRGDYGKETADLWAKRFVHQVMIQLHAELSWPFKQGESNLLYRLLGDKSPYDYVTAMLSGDYGVGLTLEVVNVSFILLRDERAASRELGFCVRCGGKGTHRCGCLDGKRWVISTSGDTQVLCFNCDGSGVVDRCGLCLGEGSIAAEEP